MRNSDYTSNHAPSAFAITTGAAVDRVFCHPLENLATFQQRNNGCTVLAAAKNIFARGGMSGFYRGMPESLLTGVPTRLTVFTTYAAVKQTCSQNGCSALAGSVAAGVVSGVIEGSVTSPVELYRVRSSLGVPAVNPFHHIISGQIKDIYGRGVGLFTLRCVVGNTIILAGSEVVSSHLPDKRQDMRTRFVAGSFFGGIATFFTTPIDVLKTRVMADLASYKTCYQHFLDAWSEEALHSSLGLRLARQSVGYGVMFTVFAALQEVQNNDDVMIDDEDVLSAAVIGKSPS